MVLSERLLLALALAAAVAYTATPYAIALADRMQFYDLPVGYKGHARPTPYLGGAALMAGFALALALLAGHWASTAPMLAGVAVLWVVGTVDDRRHVSPLARVAVEAGLAVAIWALGLGWDLHAGAPVDLAVTCAWIAAVVNAFNLFDNMDGAASTMALVACAGIVLLGLVDGLSWLPIAAVALAGACLGFLPRNVSRPARVFLGDGGSMPLGFAVAFLAMRAAVVSVPAWQSLPIGLLLVGVPALDTCLVVVSRRRRGVSLLTGGRDHLTHRTRRLLPSARAVAFTLGGAQAVVSVAAVLATRGGASVVVIGAILYLLAGALTIVALELGETQHAHPARAVELASGASAPERSRAALLVLAALGLGAGLSPFLFAYYDASTWAPVGLVLTLACAVAVIARPLGLGGPGALALGGLLGLGIWSLASTTWAESVDGAVLAGNRWMVYGALLALLLGLVRSDRRATWLLAFTAAGVAAVALSVLARLLGGDPASLFLGGRLNSPLGYINGEGCLFAIGFWLFLAGAESRRAPLAGLAAGAATLMACLALLSQSRGTALAMLVSLALVLALVPGRTRRAYLLLVLGAAVALAVPALLHVYRDAAGGVVPLASAHAAGSAALLAACAAGSVWGLVSAAWGLATVGRPSPSSLRRRGSWLLALPVALALAFGVGAAHRVEREASSQWRAFTDITGPTAGAASSRLLSGAGNRYDYWRIAWHVWRAHPLLGVGAGNYPRSYYEQRATAEDVEQPHSIELQALSELGLPGALLLACLLAAFVWAALRMRAAAAREQLPRALLTAGVGVFAAWLAQTSVDWMHLLPGLTAIALIALTALLGPRRRSGRDTAPARRGRALALTALLVSLTLAGASLSRQGLAQVFRARAEDELAHDPAAALADADSALNVDSDALRSYYLKAAALARFDRAGAAEGTLRQALAREPASFVTWTLLGDIAARRGRNGQAREDYVHAQLLNPRDATLRELAKPASATHR